MTREQALQAVKYDRNSGNFWRARNSARTKIGYAVGTLNKDGYLVAKIGLRRYMLHRLAWLIEYGSWPDGEIDHINGRRDDNRIDNLRLSTRSQNMMNSRAKFTNKLGIKGVRKTRSGSYQVRITKDGKTITVGTFPTKQEAIIAWTEAARAIHGQYAITQENTSGL